MSYANAITAVCYLVIRDTTAGFVTVARFTSIEPDMDKLRTQPAFRVTLSACEHTAVLCVRDQAGEWWMLATADSVETPFGWGVNVTWNTTLVPCYAYQVELIQTEMRDMSEYHRKDGNPVLADRLAVGAS